MGDQSRTAKPHNQESSPWQPARSRFSDSDDESPSDLFEICLKRAQVALTPSFLHSRLLGQSQTPAPKLHAIAALDGLRGWACLLVFNFHLLFTYTHKTMTGWGFGGEDGDNWGIHQLPIVHLLISGHVMVAIFFVISGYVLSHKPLKQLRSHSWEQAFHTLSSSTFRRALRLYLPTMFGMFLVLIAVRLGCYQYSIGIREEGFTIRGTNEEHPPYFTLLTEQLWDWYYTIVRLMDPWHWALYYNDYNPHLWTIPVEFRCSIILFLAILVTSRLRPVYRLSAISGLLWFCVRWGRWDVVLFLSGMLLSETDLICGLWEYNNNNNKDSLSLENGHELSDLEKQIHSVKDQVFGNRLSGPSNRHLWLILFVVGLWLASSPNSAPTKTPGYRWLSLLIPRTYPEPHRFVQSIGAVTIVACINHSPDLQRFCTTPLAQYLGKISYAFYIVHGPILHALGYSIVPNVWKLTGRDTDLGFCLGLFGAYIVCLPLSIWAADVFWRAVDIPSVRFARDFEQQVIVPSVKQ